MEKSTSFTTVNACSMSGVRPVMTPLPYPPARIIEDEESHIMLLQDLLKGL